MKKFLSVLFAASFCWGINKLKQTYSKPFDKLKYFSTQISSSDLSRLLVKEKKNQQTHNIFLNGQQTIFPLSWSTSALSVPAMSQSWQAHTQAEIRFLK